MAMRALPFFSFAGPKAGYAARIAPVER